MDKFIQGKPVKEEPKKEEVREEKPAEGIGSSEEIVKELKLRPFREFFGVGTDKDDKLLYIVDFFGKDIKEPEAIIQKIVEAEGKLGKGPFEDRIERLYRYVRLLNHIKNELSQL